MQSSLLSSNDCDFIHGLEKLAGLKKPVLFQHQSHRDSEALFVPWELGAVSMPATSDQNWHCKKAVIHQDNHRSWFFPSISVSQ